MSNIRATTISDAAGTGPITLTGQSAAKAWVHFTTFANPPSISASFNVSSLTDITSEIEVNLTNSMSDALFAPSGGAALSPNNPGDRNISFGCVSSSIINTEVYSTSSVNQEAFCYLIVHGDLA